MRFKMVIAIFIFFFYTIEMVVLYYPTEVDKSIYSFQLIRFQVVFKYDPLKLEVEVVT